MSGHAAVIAAATGHRRHPPIQRRPGTPAASHSPEAQPTDEILADATGRELREPNTRLLHRPNQPRGCLGRTVSMHNRTSPRTPSIVRDVSAEALCESMHKLLLPKLPDMAA
jgi:hypothetical protein